MKKKVLITGVVGFIGYSLAIKLLNENCHVIGVDNFDDYYSTKLKKKRLSQLKKYSRFQIKVFNIEKYESFNIIKKYNFDHIFHLAAQAGVRYSAINPNKYIKTNILGTINLFKFASTKKIKSIFFASSSSVYGDTKNKIKKEKELGNPLSPYAVTKVNNESYAKIYSKLYNMKIIGLRYFNVFGYNQDQNSIYSAVIPKWIRLMKNDKIIPIFGDGKNSRDFCYIENVIQANMLAALEKKIKNYEVFNVAVGNSTNLNQLFKLMSKIFKIKAAKKVHIKPRVGDVRYSTADISKIRKILNYRPRFTINSGLKEISNQQKN